MLGRFTARLNETMKLRAASIRIPLGYTYYMAVAKYKFNEVMRLGCKLFEARACSAAESMGSIEYRRFVAGAGWTSPDLCEMGLSETRTPQNPMLYHHFLCSNDHLGGYTSPVLDLPSFGQAQL